MRRRLLEDNIDSDYVDLGLPSGLKWAKGNLKRGDDLYPEIYVIGEETDYGAYVAWGDRSAYNRNQNHYFTSSLYTSTRQGVLINTNIPADKDICSIRLGSPWRLPTNEDFEELCNNTDIARTTINGVNGIKFMKKTNHNIYIFLPKSGYRSGNSNSLVYSTGFGYYWSSSFYSDTKAYYMYLDTSTAYAQYTSDRYRGFCVRPVK